MTLARSLVWDWFYGPKVICQETSLLVFHQRCPKTHDILVEWFVHWLSRLFSGFPWLLDLLPSLFLNKSICYWFQDLSRCQDPKITKLHFAIGSGPINSEALHYHYLDLPILCTSADLKYYHSHLVDFILIVLNLSDHMIIGCHHPGCLTVEYTFVFIAIFSYLLCFTFSSALKSVLLFVLVQFWYQLSSVSSSVL